MITIEEWMKGTSVFAYPRSPEMKAIDEAIRSFKEQSPSSRKAIETALENWKEKEKKSGQDWMQSRRNKNGTIEKLDAELHHLIRTRTPEELVAMWEVRKGNEQNLKTLFSGKQVVVKNSKAASGAGTISSAASSVEKSLKSGVKAVKAAASGASPTDIVNQLCGGSSSILGTSGNAVLSAFSKAMPLLNVISGGVSVSSKLVSIAKSGWMKYRTAEQARSSFAPGDPAAALDALKVMIGREMKETAFDAASEALKLGADITALVASGGIAAPVTSFVTDFARNVGQLCYTVYLFGRDQSEAGTANRYLIKGPWDLSLFKYCPLLGCYVLACSTTSAVIAMSVHQYGRPGWLVDTEVMKKKADPLIDKAGELIRGGRYEIPELSHFKGVVSPSINKWSNLFLAKASAFKYELETSKDEGAKFKPHVPTKGELPADFKSRITGQGSSS
jgi:hypothetical protein